MIKLLLIVLIIFIIFGAGKLPKVMADIGKGLRHLREGLQGDDEPDTTGKPAPKIIENEHTDSKK